MSPLFKIFKSEKRKIPPELPKRDYFKYSSIATKDSKLSKIGYDVSYLLFYFSFLCLLVVLFETQKI